MAEKDELAQLREDMTQQQAASVTLVGIVQENDKKLTEVLGAVRSIQAHQAIVDGRLDTMDGRLNVVDARLNAMQRDIETSFAQIENTMATKQDLAGMATKQDVAALETRMADSFTQLLTLLDERLPKTGE